MKVSAGGGRSNVSTEIVDVLQAVIAQLARRSTEITGKTTAVQGICVVRVLCKYACVRHTSEGLERVVRADTPFQGRSRVTLRKTRFRKTREAWIACCRVVKVPLLLDRFPAYVCLLSDFRN